MKSLIAALVIGAVSSVSLANPSYGCRVPSDPKGPLNPQYVLTINENRSIKVDGPSFTGDYTLKAQTPYDGYYLYSGQNASKSSGALSSGARQKVEVKLAAGILDKNLPFGNLVVDGTTYKCGHLNKEAMP